MRLTLLLAIICGMYATKMNLAVSGETLVHSIWLAVTSVYVPTMVATNIGIEFVAMPYQIRRRLNYL